MNEQINQERLKEIQSRPLYSGAHSPGEAMCVMEAVAYVAGEEWSDKPACACPVVSAFCRQLNDRMPDEKRGELFLSLVASLVGSKATPEIELKRAFMAADWAVRVAAPMSLDARGLASRALVLRNLTPISDRETADAARAAYATAYAANAADAARAAAYAANAADAAAANGLDIWESSADLISRMLEVN